MTMSETNSRPCAVCGKPATDKHRPFCSGRCQQVDLGRWFSGTYRVETPEGPDDGDDAARRETEN